MQGKIYLVSEDILNLLLEQVDKDKPKTYEFILSCVQNGCKEYKEETDGSKA